MFYPKDASVPSRLETKDFAIVPVYADDVTLDEYFEAYHNFEAGFPPDGDDYMEWEDRLQSHRQRLSFSFFVLDNATKGILGGLTIRPAALLNEAHSLSEIKAEPEPECEAVVHFWVLKSKQAEDLDRRLLATLIDWTKQEWAFSRVLFELELSNNQERQVQLFKDAGLELKFTDRFGDPVYGERCRHNHSLEAPGMLR